MSSVIETGKIKKNKGSHLQEEVDYEMIFLDESGLNEMVDLQEIIIQSLEDKEIFRKHSLDYFRDHFKVENSVIGIYTEDGLIAYNVLYFPDSGGDNFGADIGLSTDELSKVVHLETVAVHPIYRGNFLQRRMEGIHLKIIRKMGYEHVCCTVSPKNRPSLQNILSNGLVIKALKLKFGGRLRYIMYMNLLRPSIVNSEEVRINSSNIEGQVSLLNNGFLGFQLSRLSDGFEISYGRDFANLD